MASRHLPLPLDVLEELQPLIDGLAEQVALIGTDGIILAVNRQWRRQVERQARSGLQISRDYEAFLRALVAEGDKGAQPILEAFSAIRAGARRSFSCVYLGAGTFVGYDFKVDITALTAQGQRYVMVTVQDVTELLALKTQSRRRGSQLLHAQEAERRRMARDIHDSTAQALVALQLNLMRLSAHQVEDEGHAIVADCKKAVQDVHREIRALSFLAHPPELSNGDLANAIENLVAGFAKRADLEVDVTCSGIGAISRTIEATIFRLAQEGLANVHRHAAATHARVRLIGRERYVHLLVADNGVGFEPPSKQAPRLVGVGVLGMIERVRELGGRLSFGRSERGTLLWATLPREKAKPEARS